MREPVLREALKRRVDRMRQRQQVEHGHQCGWEERPQRQAELQK
jgi:hypothetical protein